MSFLDDFQDSTNETTTFNGAKAYKTTKSGLLDFFAMAGSVRNRDEQSILRLFVNALEEDELLALKALFYIRDIRGGQGERDTFRTCINYLALNRPNILRKSLKLIPEYGRWDDMYSVFDTVLKDDAVKIIKKQMNEDLENFYNNKPVSLLFKWLKSINTSSEKSRELGRKTMKLLGFNKEKDYRKLLSRMRRYIDIVERKLTDKRYNEINYENVPSKAMSKYMRTFKMNDGIRFDNYIEKVKSGKKKINASTLTPDDIVSKVLNSSESSEVLEQLWKNLPDYVQGSNSNSIVVADVSGSMEGKPIEVSIGLAIYFAEKNTGPYKNHFITFSRKPELIKIVGKDISEKVNFISRADWDLDTNIELVFDKILNTAIENDYTKEDLPNNLYIVSDMEFNEATPFEYEDEKLFDTIEKKYKEHGYDLPNLIFWNVNSIHNNLPKIDNGVKLISGFNPSILKYILENEDLDGTQLMLKILNSERYKPIEI